jgi:ectoine hydroxylase-related dioxygenase (phytanoyl-CoA dioxygenase family)
MDRYGFGYGEGKPGNPSGSYAAHPQLRDIRKRLPLRVLSDADFAHWQRYGFVVVRQAISPERVAGTAQAIWAFEGKDPHDPATWYATERRGHEMAELNNSGMVEMYNTQALWDNRQSERIYDAFVDIWDREDLWVTIDRCNLNPPNRQGREFAGFIHWDCETTLEPLPVNVQGVLSLVDATPEMGGFQCVPELFEVFDDWRKRDAWGAHPQRNPWRPEPRVLERFAPQWVPLKAGDLLIFNSLLAHGIKPNMGDDVRLAQYIAMTPADEGNAQLREWRVRSWREREAPQGYAFPGDPRQREKTDYATAALTPLGERLLGLRSWRV